MNEPDGSHVRVQFYIPQDDGTFEVESLWAVPVAIGYRLDNIPFFVRGLAWGDVVSVEAEPDGGLRYKELVATSGHSTVRVLLSFPGDTQRVRDELGALGCSSERWRNNLIAVDVPPNVAYESVRSYLDIGEKAGLFEYEEGCLADR